MDQQQKAVTHRMLERALVKARSPPISPDAAHGVSTTRSPHVPCALSELRPISPNLQVLPEDLELPETLIEEVTKERFAATLADMRNRGTTDEKLKELISPENFEKYKAVSRPQVQQVIKGDLALKALGRCLPPRPRASPRPRRPRRCVLAPAVRAPATALLTPSATPCPRPGCRAGSRASPCRRTRSTTS